MSGASLGTAVELGYAPNFTDLRNITTTGLDDGYALYVGGYGAEGDGGGGTFAWNASDTTTDNDGTIRLAVDPSNLTFDESLRSFAILNAPARRPTSKGGRERYHAGHNKDLKKGAKRASEFVARSLKLIGME